jgi:hypothetical protein
VPLPFMALGLIVSVVQTLVFVLLSMIYIALATADSGHGDHDKAHDKGHTPAPTPADAQLAATPSR